jgi:PAS domain S-box-containing protein
MPDKRLPWILVVDDNDANRYAVARMLRGAGFETSEAETGRQAIALAQREPDVIVLDVRLPDMHGFEVVRILRADPHTAVIPILHISASYMRDEDRVIGLDNGANAYLTHPVEPPVFIATVRSLVRVRRLEEARQTAASEWQATFDAISDVVCVLDRGGAITRANRAALDCFKRGPSDVIGKQWTAVMVDAFPGIDIRVLTTAVEERQTVVHQVKTRDLWLRIAFDPLPAQASFEGTTVVVVSDVTLKQRAEEERTAALAAAQQALKAAEDASNAKGEFLATMSHELRTPINAILGYAQLLDMGIAGKVSPEQRVQLDRLRRSAAHLLQLVTEVFDLATVNAGEMRVEREQAAVDDVVEDALAIGRPLALARGITIDAGHDGKSGHGLFYVGDIGRVRQILVNLLSNAVKFSAPGDHIEIESTLATPPALESLEAAGDRRFVAIRVRDTGVGISPTQMKAIFDPFVQAVSGTTRTVGGSGLGLTISRRLARLMGGDITVESDVGTGSLFTLWLPASADQALIATAEQPSAQRATAAFDPQMFAELGRVITAEALSVGNGVAMRLRTSGDFPPSGTLNDAQLLDHIPAYIADLGLALVIVSEVGVEASALLHDGNAIRNEIAERHGAQRHRLGWSTADVEREYDILLEELERALRLRATVSEAQLDGGIELLARLVAQAAAASARGHKES